MPSDKAGEFYEEATRGRSASHHLQVKAALALLYDVLGSTNPFAECPAPKFAPEKTDLRYQTSSQLGELLRELREERRSYFGHLTYHLAVALFFTGCRFHEWARLTFDRLVHEPGEHKKVGASPTFAFFCGSEDFLCRPRLRGLRLSTHFRWWSCGFWAGGLLRQRPVELVDEGGLGSFGLSDPFQADAAPSAKLELSTSTI